MHTYTILNTKMFVFVLSAICMRSISGCYSTQIHWKNILHVYGTKHSRMILARIRCEMYESNVADAEKKRVNFAVYVLISSAVNGGHERH